MNINLHCRLSDPCLDSTCTNQRQLAVSVSAIAGIQSSPAPLNLCLILDCSGSMAGEPWQQVQVAASQIVDALTPQDSLSIITFNHQGEVLVPQQQVAHRQAIKQAIERVKAHGGTAIDAGLQLGIEEALKGRQESISQIFLLTDGENEHGNNARCFKLAHLAADSSLTLSTLGFGDHWNQDVLEPIADAGGGSLSYIQHPREALDTFNRLLTRAQLVGLTNAYLIVNLLPGTRLAELKPFAQVAPDTIELSHLTQRDQVSLRLGDLMVNVPRVVVANLYLQKLVAEGTYPIAQIQVQYDDPIQGQNQILSEPVTVVATAQSQYRPQPDVWVQQQVMALAKYRQTRLAEHKLAQGDHRGAATLLQSAAKTALQMGDINAATVLQENATRLQTGQELTERDRKTTRLVSKTLFQP